MMLSNGKVVKLLDNKLTDNEIVKALEYCSRQGITSECERCKVKGCRSELIKLALDLINRLQAENEELKTENQILSQQRFNIFERIEYSDKLKAEAYKECIEKVKEIDLYQFIEEYYQNAELRYEVRRDWFDEHINNLLKELVGEDK